MVTEVTFPMLEEAFSKSVDRLGFDWGCAKSNWGMEAFVPSSARVLNVVSHPWFATVTNRSTYSSPKNLLYFISPGYCVGEETVADQNTGLLELGTRKKCGILVPTGPEHHDLFLTT